MASELLTAGGAIVSSMIGAGAADDAADQAATAIEQASGISESAAAQARQDLLDTFTPAYQDLEAAIAAAVGLVEGGQTSTSDILTDFSTQLSGIFEGSQALSADVIGAGMTDAVNTIFTGQSTAGGALVDLSEVAIDTLGGISTDVSRAGTDIAGADFSLADVQNFLETGTSKAVGELEGFAGTGEEAFQQAAALTGALGADAQQAAFDSYIESPGQAYLRGKEETALLGAASATGGLQGGNVLTALQEQAVDIASTQLDDQIANLLNLGSSGLSAAGDQAGFEQESGVTGATIAGSLEGQKLSADADLQATAAQLAATANLEEARLQESVGTQVAGVQTGLGSSLADLATGASQSAAGALQTGTGQALDVIQQGAAGQAAAVGDLGSALAGLDQSTIANLSNLLTGGVGNLADIEQQLGISLANLGVGQGTEQVGLTTGLGEVQAAGTLGSSSAMQDLVAALSGLGAGAL